MTSSDQSCNRKKPMWTSPRRFGLVFLGFQKLKDWSQSRSMALGVKKPDWTGLPNTIQKQLEDMLAAQDITEVNAKKDDKALISVDLEDFVPHSG